MKFLYFCITLISLPLMIHGETKKTTPPIAKSKLFSVELSLGKYWDTTKEAYLQTGFQEHVANMKKLRTEGKLIIGARYGDLGMLIIKADSIAEVFTIMQNDPMVADSLFNADIQQFNTFYDGCTLSEE
ncbi:MAG: hypothetical protein DWP97_10315 [Calditrichaeota bacterium]|nr:MAG: hypothetical protein DWP97_10315 [Calditrichota bacterium]